MSVEIVPAFEVVETNDEYGTRGRRVGVFTNSGKAEEAAKGRGAWGSKGTVDPAYVIIADGKAYLLASQFPVELNVDAIRSQEQKIAAAKAKLSAEERQLLGIK